MVLQAINLSKNFGKNRVLNNVTFTVNRGEVLGIAGPNGSGKTTLLNILMGMIAPSHGEFRIDHSVRVGMAVSRKGFFNDMSVKNNIYLYAKLKGVSIETVLKLMEEFLIDFGDEQYGNLSAGMKQRVSLANSFLSHPDLILLDEPTNHLDIDSILFLRSKILGMKATGTTFLVTSHIFSDLEKVCDTILFMKNGEVIHNAKTEELMSKYGNLENAYLQIV